MISYTHHNRLGTNNEMLVNHKKDQLLTQIVNPLQRMVIVNAMLYFISRSLVFIQLYCLFDTQTEFDHEQSNRDSSYLVSCSIDSADSPLELLEDGGRNVCKFH